MEFPVIRLRRVRDSLFSRTLIVAMVLILGGSATRQFLLSQFMNSEALSGALAAQQALANHLAHGLDQQLRQRDDTLQRLAQALPPQLLERPDDLRDWLRQHYDLLPLFSYGLFIEDLHGRVIAQYPVRPRPFQSALAGPSDGPTIGVAGAAPAVSMTVFLGGPDGRARAVLRGVTLLGMPGLVDQMDGYKNGQNGGYWLVFPREQLYMEGSKPVVGLFAMPASALTRLLAQADGRERSTRGGADDVDAADQVAAQARVGGAGWVVLAHLPAGEAFAMLEHAKQRQVKGIFFHICVALLFLVPVLYVVLQPLRRTARHADQMTRGEIPLEALPIIHDDEVSDLTAAFNRLLHKLTEKSAELTVQKELAETAALAKSRFLAAASHDLRQPMHALSLYLGTLASFDLPAAARPVLTSVRYCAQTMDEMFRALLDISRLDASTMQAECHTFPIATLLHKIEVEFSQQALAKGLTLRVARCAAYVVSDPEMLERILRNLVSNALRYTTRGKILVGCRRVGGALQLHVYDTGIGIAQADQQAIFEEFYQVGNRERDRAQGLGLGLAIVRRLARLLDAPLTMRSTPARGTLFSLTLVRATVPQEGPAGAPTDGGMALRTHVGWLVAVVDDELMILDATRLLLEHWGYQVVAAASGAELIALLAESDCVPDAIVCDHRLRGDETGIDVIFALRNEFNCDIPALLVTGDTSPERIKAIEATGLPVLHKPIQDYALQLALSALLNQSLTD